MKRSCSGFLLVPFLLAIPPGGTVQAQTKDWCSASPEIQSALDNLPIRTIQETTWEYQQRRQHALEELLRRYPDEMFVRRAFNGAQTGAEKDKLVADYKSQHEKHPDDPEIAFLYGLLLEGRNSPEAIKVLEGALAKSPEYPWLHRPLERIYNSPVFQDKARVDAHVKAFIKGCPNLPGAYGDLANVSDKRLMSEGAARMRALIENQTTAGAVSAYQSLWSLEFKTHNPPEYPEVRKQVSRDLEHIQSLKLEDKVEWYATLQAGYKLVNGEAEADRIAAEQAKRFPATTALPALAKWVKEHPAPKPEDPPAKKLEYYSQLLPQVESWLKERPNQLNLWNIRLDALAKLDDTSAADLKAAAEAFLQFGEKDAGPSGAYPYIYLNTAEALAKRHLDPQRVAELAKKGMARAEAAEPPSDLYMTKDNQVDYEFYRPYSYLRGAALEAGGYLDLKQADRAEAVLEQMNQRLHGIEKYATGKEEYRTEYAGQMSKYWGLVARVAVLREHPVDALAFYGNAISARFDSQQKPERGSKDELADGAQQLWSKLGGTSDGWKLWYGQRAEALAKKVAFAWETANEPLPSFELTDVNGKSWNLASLKGKVNFLNFWASW
jgi:hypothetical protein